jgi:hypothetical protein
VPVAEEVVMTALRAGRRRRLVLVGALVVLAAAAFAPTSAATPTYEGGAFAGWGYQEGDVLTANPGTWTSTTDISYTYAWFNENSVALGTGPTYKIAGRDVGHQIYAAITASDGSPPPLIVNTPTVGPMRYRPPVNVEVPTISGALLEGSTLKANGGKWVSGGASTAPIDISYAWYRGCTIGPKPDCSNSGYIGGESSLVLTSGDVGRPISLGVTASYPDGAGGQASSSVWLGNLGPVVSSSVKAGYTLTGKVQWTVTAPGAETIAFLVNGARAGVQGADASGVSTFVLDTTTLADGSNDLALTVTWNDGRAPTTVQIGSVTVANGPPPPVVVKPLIGKPRTTPMRPVAGQRLLVTFAVTRSDNHRPLTQGRMLCAASVRGKAIAHAQSFVNGKARLAVKIPKTAKHKLLRVRVTIRLGDQSTTRIATFLVR